MSEEFYDSCGGYMGRKDDSGAFYDASGAYLGRKDADGGSGTDFGIFKSLFA